MLWQSAYSRRSASSKNLDALLVDAMVSGLFRFLENQFLELLNLAVPAQLQGIQPGLGPDSLQQAGLIGQSQGVIGKAVVVCEGGFEAILTMADVFRGGGVIKSNDGQSAGHGFQHHVAEGVGFAGEQK